MGSERSNINLSSLAVIAGVWIPIVSSITYVDCFAINYLRSPSLTTRSPLTRLNLFSSSFKPLRHSSSNPFIIGDTFQNVKISSGFRTCESNLKVVKIALGKLTLKFQRATNQCMTQLIRSWINCRRSIRFIFAIFLFWFATAGTFTSASHGSTLPVPKFRSNEFSSIGDKFSASTDEIVERYVSEHMFDNDVYDPIESIYRESMDDELRGSYLKRLKETAWSVLGQNAVKTEKKGAAFSFAGALTKSIVFLRRQGLSEMQAIMFITGIFFVGTPSILVFLFLSIVSQNKRSMNKLMKQRYGDAYSVDATAKVEDFDVPDNDDENDNEKRGK